MFSFLRSKVTPLVFKQDIHAHLLPGIDDGPKTIAESIAMIEYLKDMGYEKLTATPHVYWEYYPNTSRMIIEKFRTLKAELQQRAIDINLTFAAEYYLDDHFEALIAKDDLLPVFREHVLVECSTIAATTKLNDYLFAMRLKGYTPIMAHPERYLYFKEADYQNIVDQGCELQINFLSIMGHYGKEIQKRALFLLKTYLIHYFSTDAHHIHHLQKIKTFLASGKAQKLLKNKIIQQR